MRYETWHPKLKRGFFYVGDQQFYLFADKKVNTVAEALFYEFELANLPISILEARFGSRVISPDDLRTDDKMIMFRSTALDDTNASSVTLIYTIQEIVAGKIVQTPQTPVSLALVDATMRYFLDPIPVAGYPIIFTDDAIEPLTGDETTHAEFDVDQDTGEVVFFDSYVPTIGTFEYEGSDQDYVTITQIDLNPANTGRVTGLLSIGPGIGPDINQELY